MKSQIPAGQQVLQTQAPLPFLKQLESLAQPINKAETNKADPIQSMRAKFSANADEQLKLIKAAADNGRWFKRLPDGKLVVFFRNANSVMSLSGSTHFQVANAAAAVKLVEAAKAAVAGGELDDALKATQRKRPQKAKTPEAA